MGKDCWMHFSRMKACKWYSGTDPEYKPTKHFFTISPLNTSTVSSTSYKCSNST